MAKSVKNESPTNDEAGKQDLESLIQSGQGAGAGGGSPDNDPPPAPPPAGDKSKAKSREPDYANQTRRSGDKCPRPGCHGILTVMSTHRGKEFKIRHLACNSCKKVGGKEVIPL